MNGQIMDQLWPDLVKVSIRLRRKSVTIRVKNSVSTKHKGVTRNF